MTQPSVELVFSGSCSVEPVMVSVFVKYKGIRFPTMSNITHSAHYPVCELLPAAWISLYIKITVLPHLHEIIHAPNC